jgi:hypothetical protein
MIGDFISYSARFRTTNICSKPGRARSVTAAIVSRHEGEIKVKRVLRKKVVEPRP